MTCKKCGTQIPDGATTCPSCGAAVEATRAVSAGPQPNTLLFGILSLVFCETVILSLIFAIIGRKKGKAYIAQGGTLTGASKVGFVLSKLGLIFAILSLIVCAVVIILLVAGVISADTLSTAA